jgi:DNA replication ATP-dependent helicase Dna2
MAALVDGAEDWDWGEMEADFLTPQKKKKATMGKSESKVGDGDSAGYRREPCTRCVVERIVEGDNAGRYENVREINIYLLGLWLISFFFFVRIGLEC